MTEPINNPDKPTPKLLGHCDCCGEFTAHVEFTNLCALSPHPDNPASIVINGVKYEATWEEIAPIYLMMLGLEAESRLN